MTSAIQRASLFTLLAEMQRRLADLEGHSPQSYSVNDASGQVRVIWGRLDALGGSYTGKYGIVVLDSGGTAVFSQSA